METFIFIEKEKFLLIVSAQYCRKFWSHSPRSISFFEHQHAWNEQETNVLETYIPENPLPQPANGTPPRVIWKPKTHHLRFPLISHTQLKSDWSPGFSALSGDKSSQNPWETLTKTLTFKTPHLQTNDPETIDLFCCHLQGRYDGGVTPRFRITESWRLIEDEGVAVTRPLNRGKTP